MSELTERSCEGLYPRGAYGVMFDYLYKGGGVPVVDPFNPKAIEAVAQDYSEFVGFEDESFGRLETLVVSTARFKRAAEANPKDRETIASMVIE